MTASRIFYVAPDQALAVEHGGDLSVDLSAPYRIETPTGLRQTYPPKAGTMTGRITGTLLDGGGDWVVVGSDGVSRMDIRQTIRTDDGALIHFAALGVVRLPADGRERVARGERVAFTDSYIRSTPRLETDHDRYQWVNGQVFVSIGEFSAGHIDHRIYRVL